MSVILDGAILMGIATSQVKSVQTGPQHWLNAGKKTQCLLMSTIMRRMSTYNMSTMEKNPGWDWMTLPQKVPLLGQIAGLGTLQLGPKTNQTILEKKTVCMHLVLNTNINGMTWNAVTVISIRVRKVSFYSSKFYVCENNKRCTNKRKRKE